MVEDNTDPTPEPATVTPPIETPSVIEQAQKLHDDIKSENDRRQELIERDEALYAKKMLGGQSSAGTVPEPVKEETPQEYAKKVMAGDLNG